MKKIPIGWLIAGGAVAVGAVGIAVYEKMKGSSSSTSAGTVGSITPARVTGAESTALQSIAAGQHTTNPSAIGTLPAGVVFMAQSGNGSATVPKPPAGTNLTVTLPSSGSFAVAPSTPGLTAAGQPVVAVVGYGPTASSFKAIDLGSDLKSPFSLSAAQLQNASVVGFEWVDSTGKHHFDMIVLS